MHGPNLLKEFEKRETRSLRSRRPTKYAAIGIRRYLVVSEGWPMSLILFFNHQFCVMVFVQFAVANYILADHPKCWRKGTTKVSNDLERRR